LLKQNQRSPTPACGAYRDYLDADAGDKQNIVLAIDHHTREIVAQARQSGDKSSEIPVVRELLKDSGLEKQKVSLDAHHFNPITTAQIHQADGIYLTQVKENQAIFLKQCKSLPIQSKPLAETISHEKAHGRVTTRRAQLFSLDSLSLDSRWQSSGLSALIVMERETVEVAKQKTTFDTSYYVSNSAIESSSIQALTEELAGAIRFHWGVESNNWIRDVTFNGHPETLFAFLIRYLLRVRVRLESHWTYRQIVGLALRLLA
jgi:predicted transposase YbfD/YdcC